MVSTGYVSLKLKADWILSYVDWTNTRREYDLKCLNPKDIEDLRRLFLRRNVVLVPSKEKMIPILRRKIGNVDYSNVVSVGGNFSPAKMLFTHLSKHGLPGGHYNHRRGIFLSIVSTINLHMMIYGLLSKEMIMKIIRQELYKYWRKSNAHTLFRGFVRTGLFRRVTIVDTSSKNQQKCPHFTF